jgi:hypothetical protein
VAKVKINVKVNSMAMGTDNRGEGFRRDLKRKTNLRSELYYYIVSGDALRRKLVTPSSTMSYLLRLG